MVATAPWLVLGGLVIDFAVRSPCRSLQDRYQSHARTAALKYHAVPSNAHVEMGARSDPVVAGRTRCESPLFRLGKPPPPPLPPSPVDDPDEEISYEQVPPRGALVRSFGRAHAVCARVRASDSRSRVRSSLAVRVAQLAAAMKHDKDIKDGKATRCAEKR